MVVDVGHVVIEAGHMVIEAIHSLSPGGVNTHSLPNLASLSSGVSR